MKKIASLFLILNLSAGLLSAEVAPEKKQEIIRMIKLTGVTKSMDDFKLQILNSLRSQLPQENDAFWQKTINKIDMNMLIEKLIPIYDKYYSLEDLKAVNAFYESPVGQKILTQLPMIMDESSKVGQNWGENMRQEILDDAKAESGK